MSKFTPMSDKTRGLIFILVEDYARNVYNSNSKFYITKSLKDIKEAYQKATKFGEGVPFQDFFSEWSRQVKSDNELGIRDYETVEYITEKLIIKHAQRLYRKKEGVFSISNRVFSQEDASDFLSWIIGYFMEQEIEFSTKVIETLDRHEKEKFIWLCLKNKKCCICGKEVSFPHHRISVNAVGGYKQDDGSLPIAPLCKYHHSELHNSTNKFEWEKQYESYGYILCNDKQKEILEKVYKGLFMKDAERREEDVIKPKD